MKYLIGDHHRIDPRLLQYDVVLIAGGQEADGVILMVIRSGIWINSKSLLKHPSISNYSHFIIVHYFEYKIYIVIILFSTALDCEEEML